MNMEKIKEIFKKKRGQLKRKERNDNVTDPIVIETNEIIARNGFEKQFSATWILYHLAATLADQKRSENGKETRLSASIMSRISNDIQLFVLHACQDCARHHSEYLKEHPFAKASTYARHVFDMHNCVNKRIGKSILSDFDIVRAHYEGELAKIGRGVTVTLISSALPVTTKRYCYRCGA
ncbi:MAG: hypothetical protein CL916_10610 [Deltaproteobacteria bacterium]|nr:hypothetical protein [Deltaproteobacteria bacterium]